MDVVVGALTAAAAATGVSIDLIDGLWTLGVLAPVLAFAAIVLGRMLPVLGLVALAAAPLLSSAVAHDPMVTWTITVFGAFLLTYRGLHPVLTGPVIGAADYLAVAGFESDPLSPTAFLAISFAVAAAASGSAVRARLEAIRVARQRAVDAREAREVAADRRVAEERLRIARDLHDMVGHEVAVLSLQLGMVEVALPADADRAREALVATRAGVQSILHETQRILSVLRVGSEDPTRQPVPDIARIADVVASFRAVGLAIDAELDEAPEHLDPAVSAAAYRIVQEGLTNAQRHGTGPVALRLALDERRMTVTIRNAVAAEPTATGGGGYGLVGMRERVQSAGGRLDIDDSRGRFTVTAVLALDG
jgi:signal transduction histidine kinase